MRYIEITKPKLDYAGAEAMKSLRTNLQFCGSDKKAIVFTSCTQNEGKTHIVLNLGISLAEAGKKVVMIDADLRKSMLLGRIESSAKVDGLTHFLSRQNVLGEVVYTTNVENFSMVFAGPVPPNPSELLDNELFEAMIKSLKAHYDYVLIDSPPLGSVIDSAVIAKQCDGAIMVIESGWNSWRFEAEIKDQIEKSGCPILGVILNKVDTSSQKYYGRYGHYGKYGKYGKYGAYGAYGNTPEQ